MFVKFAVLADYAIISREGKLSVLGIFDQVNLPEIPGVMPTPMYLVVSLEGESSEMGSSFNLELLLWDEDGTRLFENQSDFTFKQVQPGMHPTHNTLIALHGLRFSREGDHSLVVSVGGEERRRVPIRVNRIRPSQPPAEEQPS